MFPQLNGLDKTRLGAAIRLIVTFSTSCHSAPRLSPRSDPHPIPHLRHQLHTLFDSPRSSYACRLKNAVRLNHPDSCTPFPSSPLGSLSRATSQPGGTLSPVSTSWPSSRGITASWYVCPGLVPWRPLQSRPTTVRSINADADDSICF